jgi:hypothetical protein
MRIYRYIDIHLCDVCGRAASPVLLDLYGRKEGRKERKERKERMTGRKEG